MSDRPRRTIESVFTTPLKGPAMVRRKGNSMLPPRARLLGGTIINVVTGLVLLGLIGYGVYWIMKTMGEGGQQYATAMVNTHNQASSLSCQMNLRSIAQTLQTYAISNEAYPSSQQELVDFAGYGSKLFHGPTPTAARTSTSRAGAAMPPPPPSWSTKRSPSTTASAMCSCPMARSSRSVPKSFSRSSERLHPSVGRDSTAAGCSVGCVSRTDPSLRKQTP